MIPGTGSAAPRHPRDAAAKPGTITIARPRHDPSWPRAEQGEARRGRDARQRLLPPPDRPPRGGRSRRADGQHHDDAILVTFETMVRDGTALRDDFAGYLVRLRSLRIVSTEKLAATDDAMFVEATAVPDYGVTRVLDPFALRPSLRESNPPLRRSALLHSRRGDAVRPASPPVRAARDLVGSVACTADAAAMIRAPSVRTVPAWTTPLPLTAKDKSRRHERRRQGRGRGRDPMVTTIRAVFDGEVLRPDEALGCPATPPFIVAVEGRRRRSRGRTGCPLVLLSVSAHGRQRGHGGSLDAPRRARPRPAGQRNPVLRDGVPLFLATTYPIAPANADHRRHEAAAGREARLAPGRRRSVTPAFVLAGRGDGLAAVHRRIAVPVIDQLPAEPRGETVPASPDPMAAASAPYPAWTDRGGDRLDFVRRDGGARAVGGADRRCARPAGELSRAGARGATAMNLRSSLRWGRPRAGNCRAERLGAPNLR